MPMICYAPREFRGGSLEIIEKANEIIAEYQAEGYELTLRQLYYQFVARDLIPNRQTEYKRLGSIINDARLAELIDWHAIEDRTRNITEWQAWEDPAAVVSEGASSFAVDRWENQPYRVEVWVEKEALAGIFHRVCGELGIPYFSCRGYVSQSEMWSAARRLYGYARGGQTPIVLHFGDHDPSGIDMTRDIIDRLQMFEASTQLERLALNMEQVDAYGPPPNPAKITDSRFQSYMAIFGRESWELDALDPPVLAALVRDYVTEIRDEALWAETMEREQEGRRLLMLASDNWDEVADFVRGLES